MGIPQIIMIVLLSIAVFENLTKHGESKGDYNFWYSLIGVAIQVWILKCGGFF